jgi:outer membrane protein assembly factor BamD (BamD/ComL family)
MDQALFNISLAYRLCQKDDEADAARTELVERFPDSPYIKMYEKANRKTLKALKKGQRRMAKRLGRS